MFGDRAIEIAWPQPEGETKQTPRRVTTVLKHGCTGGKEKQERGP